MLFSKTIGKPLEKVLDIIGEILAFAVIVLLAFSFINAQFNFVTDPLVLQIIEFTRTYAVIGVVAIVGLEFVIDKGLILTIIYLILVAVVVVFSFLPDVQAYLLSYIDTLQG